MLQVNPADLIRMIKEGKNPQQLVLSVLEQSMGNTPLGKNLLLLVKQGRGNDIEQVARNLLSQKGLDFDSEFTAFKNKMGL